ncbi:MAG: glycosyltransferase [Prevotella sp.]|nr:glycosyltransferase [Prevotella sp.]
MTKITIVTITYNAADVLERTLESAIAQTHRDVEHIIVDGASTDQTLTLAFGYKQRSDQQNNGHTVSIVSEPDHGIYDAMNKGLKLATGDYIVFMNAGDCFHCDDTLAVVAAQAEAEPRPAVVYGDTDVVGNDGQFLYHRRLSPPEHLTWRSFRQGMLVCHQAFYARTDIAKTVDYDLRYRFSADVDWCIRVMKEAERRQLPLANTRQTVAHYLEEGQTTRNHKASLRERFDVMRRHYGLLTTLAMHAWFVVRNLKPSQQH